MSFQYSISFLIGLQATLHCVGMCGPLAFAAPINRTNTRSAVWGTLIYNFGRITTYSYLGFLLGMFSIGQTWINAIQLISLLTGFVFIATAILVHSKHGTFGDLSHKKLALSALNYSLLLKMPIQASDPSYLGSSMACCHAEWSI